MSEIKRKAILLIYPNSPHPYAMTPYKYLPNFQTTIKAYLEHASIHFNKLYMPLYKYLCNEFIAAFLPQTMDFEILKK